MDILISIYYRTNCTSSKKALKWLEDHHLEFNSKNINCISVTELIRIVSVTHNGIPDIIKRTQKIYLEPLEDIKFKKAMCFLHKNINMIQTPIIIKDNKIFVGYNSDVLKNISNGNLR